MSELKLVITTPERVVYEDTVESVRLPTVDGEITILAHHIPLVTVLKAGALILRKGQQEEPYAIGGGFIETDGKLLTILADSAEHVSEIDEAKAEEARARAIALQKEERLDQEGYAAVAAKLDRDLARLHVVRTYRHRGHHGITNEGIRKD